MLNENTTKYFIYLRKSTEGDERQALSIDSQEDKAKEMFSDLNIVDTFVEKHSAFKPYNRPEFEKMINRIRAGEANGIIAWHPDRLSRNEIDASTITYLIRTAIISDLKFGSYNFDNSPEGIMMLQLALSQSQYFSSKLGKDVKRGLEKKITLGWLPGLAPEGYLNDIRLEKGQRTIMIDKKRFPVLRKAFELMLSGLYNAQEVLNILNNQWGYITVKKRKIGGKPLSRSVWYKMLSNPFYAGIIVYNGKESKGKHKPLISLDEYNRIQELLGLRGNKKKPKRHDFLYSGLFTCAHCQCAITAEKKTKYIKSKNKFNSYHYYHCTHKKKDIVCKEGSVEEKEINKEIINKLDKLKINKVFLNWALEYLDSQKSKEKKEVKLINETKAFKIKKIEEELSQLTTMRIRNLLTDEEYLKEKNKINQNLSLLKLDDKKEKSKEDLIELTKEQFIFSAYAKKQFIEGDKQTKREILNNLGSNREIKDKKVQILVHKWLLPIYESAEMYNSKLARLEPSKFGLDYTKNEALNELRLSWLPGSDSNRRPIG